MSGRPRADRIEDTLRALDYLDEHPDASASQVARDCRLRKSVALRIVRRIRGREGRFPNPTGAFSGSVEEASG
jgi:hypothetical protein